MSMPDKVRGGSAHSVSPWALADPLFVLGAPHSFTSVVSTMLGQHPQMYGLPELHLFQSETMADWWQITAEAPFPMKHGLFRVVAELYFAGQSEARVQLARAWLRRRRHLTTGAVMEALAERAHPRILVEKSPSIVRTVESMRRAYALFPQARFVHLVRHPRGHGESAMKVLANAREHGSLPASHWVFFGSSPAPGQGTVPVPPRGSLDPQWAWYGLNRNVVEFLADIPAAQVFRVRGEEVLADPDATLRPLLAWFGLRDDPEAIEEMKHPERSPFACFGPPGARWGNNPGFIQSPALRPGRAVPASLDGPLEWRPDGGGFAPAVHQLAQEFGYT